MHTDEARAALDHIHGADLRLAEKVGHCPPLRHAAFGALFAVLVGTITVSSTVQMFGTAIVLGGVVLILQWDRKRYGVFINGYRKGATLPLTLAFVGVMVALVVAAMHMRNHDFTALSKAGLAAIAFALAVAFSLRWHHVFRRELTGA